MHNPSTIQVSSNTKKELITLKNYPNESFEILIKRIVEYMKEEDDQILTKYDLEEIKKSVEQIEQGKYKTLSQIRKKYSKK